MDTKIYGNCHPEIEIDHCTLDTCCLAQAWFTYRPNYAGNLFFACFFGFMIIPQLFFGIKYKASGFMVGMIIGCVLEVLGYVGRLLLHDNPFSGNAFLLYL